MPAIYFLPLAMALFIALGWPLGLTAQEASPSPASAAIDELAKQQADIAAKKDEIAKLAKEIAALKNKRDLTAAEAQVIDSQVRILQAQLAKAELELGQTKIHLKKVGSEQKATGDKIHELEESISHRRDVLRGFVRLLYLQEQESLIRIFFDTGSLGQVLAQRAAYEELQEQTKDVIEGLRTTQQTLQEKKSELEQQEEDLSELSTLLAAQQRDIAAQKKTQQEFLSAKQAEKAAFEQKIAEVEEARREIEQSVFTLKSAGVKLSLNNAFDMARYAGKLTGVRPALLLAVLKVESNLGSNIGSGKFPDDMHPQSREPFLRLTKKLGLDPYTAQISRRPASLKGWGGAMGPAQIMPATWEAIEGRLETLLNKQPVNPYELTDAFVATAVFLADRGAADPAREYEAVSRYIAGPNWQYYTWYADKVMAVAGEYEAELQK